MKNAVTYIVLVLCTLILAVAVVFGMMKLKPELFGGTVAPKKGGIQIAPQKSNSTDSSKTVSVVGGSSTDTVKSKQSGYQSNVSQPSFAGESIGWKDTVAALKKQIENQQLRIQMLEGGSFSQQVTVDSAKEVERTKLAKLMDAMNPTGAAQILASMKDEDIKKVLLSVKARQAGKILSAMDARRVARIMN